MQTFDPRSVSRGVLLGLAAALLFGLSTPLAKLFVGSEAGEGPIQPVLLAGLLYLGSGVGLSAWWLVRRLKTPERSRALKKEELPYLAGAVVAGGMVAPACLMLGLSMTSAAGASLLLNLEGVLTAVIAWMVFKENCNRRVVAGMIAITASSVILTTGGQSGFALSWGSLLIVLACLGWAVDNNLTRQISQADAVQIALIKGLFAGAINLAVAILFLSPATPPPMTIASAMLVGFLGYGVSLALFVLALRHLGTARTSAYFSTAPFVGAAVSVIIFSEPLSLTLVGAACLMALGVYMHITEKHDHEHEHKLLVHEHEHRHDDHHQHEHSAGNPPGEPHSHLHAHETMVHSHPHFPDLHHRHEH